MLKKIAIAVVALIVAILGFAATRPDTFRVERSATIQAPPEKIFPLVDDFRRWVSWSPFEKLDPDLQRTYGGAPSGEGAVYEWVGNQDAGSGRMEITDSAPPSRVVIDLHFVVPFEARNVAEFTFVPTGDATTVTWAMHGPSPFVAKLMGIFMDMDTMVGGAFEEGLANLKALAEK